MARQRWLALFTLAVPLTLAGCSDDYFSTGLWGDEKVEQSSHALGVFHYSSGRYGLALQFFEQAVLRDPESVESLNGMGASYDKLARYDLAERSYRRALTVNPSSAQTLNNLGYSYWLQGRYDLAFAYLRDVESNGEDQAVIAGNRQLALSKLGDLNSAKTTPVASSAVAGTPAGSGPVESDKVADVQEIVTPAATTQVETKPWIERTDAIVQTLVTRPSVALTSEIAETGVRPELVSAGGNSSVTDQSLPEAAVGPADLDLGSDERLGDVVVPPEKSLDLQPVELAEAEPLVEPSRLPPVAPTVLAPTVLASVPEANAIEFDSGAEAAAPWQPSSIATRFDGQPLGSAVWAEDKIDPRPLAAATRALAQELAPGYTRSGGLVESAGVAHASVASSPIAGGPIVALDRAHDGALQGPAAAADGTPSIEVANALGVDGMATRLGRFLRARGLPVDRLSNAPTFGQITTVITYREGWQVYAMGVASLLPTEVTLIASRDLASDIRIDLGGDLINFDRRLSAELDPASEEPAG